MKGKYLRIILIIIALLILLNVGVLANSSNRILTVGIKPGDNYMTVTAHLLGIIPRTSGPQMAVWIEDGQGNFVKTLYVTEKTAKAHWGTNYIQRPETLPVWSHSRGIETDDNYYMPTLKKPAADAVSGATPRGASIHDWQVPDKYNVGTEFIVRVEVNAAYDFNEIYDKKLPKDNPYFNKLSGQPSLVYQARIRLKEKSYEFDLELVGHGHPAGEDGKVYDNMEGIDSALKLVDSIGGGLIIE